MTEQNDLFMQRKDQMLTPGVKYWNVLEREEIVRTSPDALAYIEQHTGKLDPQLPLLWVRVLYIPDSNFFLLEIPSDDEN